MENLELLEIDTKVKYLEGDKWYEGVIHGVRTYEDSDGTVIRRTYLIDTGNNLWVSNGHEPTGNMLHNPETGKKDLPEMQEVTIRQPEQVEVDQNKVEKID